MGRAGQGVVGLRGARLDGALAYVPLTTFLGGRLGRGVICNALTGRLCREP